MRRAMRKPRDTLFKNFAEQLTEIDKFISLFPRSNTTKKMPPEELNDILLHTVPTGWAKKPTYRYGT